MLGLGHSRFCVESVEDVGILRMWGYVELRGIDFEVGSTSMYERSGGGADDGARCCVATSRPSSIATLALAFGGGRRHGH